MIRLILLLIFVTSFSQAGVIMRVAHRGAPKHAPENTLPSFRKAIAQEATHIEIDVHQTRDGELVVIHDSTVNRTTNGRGKIRNLSFKEIQALDAGSWFSPEFAGTKIPTLREVLELLHHAPVQAIIELKKGDQGSPGIVQNIIQLVEELNLQDRVIIKSFNPQVLSKMISQTPSLPTLYVFVGGSKKLPITINNGLNLKTPFAPGVKILQPHYLFTSKAFITKAHSLGFKVVVWGVETKKQMKKVLRMGADGIETDHLEILAEVLPAP